MAASAVTTSSPPLPCLAEYCASNWDGVALSRAIAAAGAWDRDKGRKVPGDLQQPLHPCVWYSGSHCGTGSLERIELPVCCKWVDSFPWNSMYVHLSSSMVGVAKETEVTVNRTMRNKCLRHRDLTWEHKWTKPIKWGYVLSSSYNLSLAQLGIAKQAPLIRAQITLIYLHWACCIKKLWKLCTT